MLLILEKPKRDPARKMSKFGKHLLSEALEHKIRDLRQIAPTVATAVNPPKPKPVPNIAVALNAAISKQNVMKVRSFDVEPSETGQIDYRKFLRKTDNCPTDTLRRRKTYEDVQEGSQES